MSDVMKSGRRGRRVNPAHLGGSAAGDARFWLLIAFVALSALAGGSAQQPTLWLVFLRMAALGGLVFLAVSPGRFDLGSIRTPLILLGLFALLMLAQLIPLPPGVWTTLPGHEHFAEAAKAAGIEQPWRALTLTPDGTWNSLACLPAALLVLCAMSGLSAHRKASLVLVLIALAGASALLGIAQIAGGDRSALYFYSITHQGSPVGLFANRNHQAALLAMTFPLLRVWVELAIEDMDTYRARRLIALGIGLLMIPMIMVTGSRAGIALGLVGLVAALFIKPPRRVFETLASMPQWQKWALVAAPILIGGVAIVLGRAIAIERFSLLLNDPDAELRVRIMPVVYKIASDFFPVGSGFGSFDPVFRYYEADGALDLRFVNRAHNDFLELAMTGGLPALLLLVVMLGWCARKTVGAFKASASRSEVLLARLGFWMLAILFLASIPDYPIRTPLMTVVATVAVSWLALASIGNKSAKAGRPTTKQI